METLSPKEAADLLNITPQTLRKYVKENKLRTEKTPGNHNRYLKDDVERLREALREGTPIPKYIEGESSLIEQKRNEAFQAFRAIGIDCDIDDLKRNEYRIFEINLTDDFGRLYYADNQIFYSIYQNLDKNLLKTSINDLEVESLEDIDEAVLSDYKRLCGHKKVFTYFIIFFLSLYTYSVATMISSGSDFGEKITNTVFITLAIGLACFMFMFFLTTDRRLFGDARHNKAATKRYCIEHDLI